ncbi:MAG: hypothetical protein ACON5N_11975, partial [Akkermansiaceae bacterium]
MDDNREMRKEDSAKWLANYSKASEVQGRLIEGADYLMMMAHRGDAIALGVLLDHAISCVRWIQS